MISESHPILGCAAAGELEKRLFAGDEAKEWAAMQQAGRAIASAVLRDAEEIGGLAAEPRLLVLAGKGHNGGDALIAAHTILERYSGARAEVLFVFGERALRPLAAKAWRQLTQAFGARVRAISSPDEGSTRSGIKPNRREAGPGGYDLCLDGVFGFQFRPPADDRVTALLREVNALPIRLRAAVDLPSAGIFRADFTYATGSVKEPVVDAEEAGRVRYLDLDFFGSNERDEKADGADRVLTGQILAPLATLRPAHCDKRSFGHVFVMGGSRSFPGAALMSVLGALRSGAGLVTAFVPESLAAAYAARVPEAMWVGWPETPAGGLALEGEHLLRERFERADALVIGPGLGREAEALALVQSIVANSPIPLVLDADAQQPEIVRAGKATRVVTPHAGEFKRIAGETRLREFVAETGATVVLKGPVTRVCGREDPEAGERKREHGQGGRAGADSFVYHNFFGGPVLARGGSGDVLSGIVGTLLAQAPQEPVLAAARGVVWHGLAAEALARAQGQVAVTTTQLLDYLGPVLREVEWHGSPNP